MKKKEESYTNKYNNSGVIQGQFGENNKQLGNTFNYSGGSQGMENKKYEELIKWLERLEEDWKMSGEPTDYSEFVVTEVEKSGGDEQRWVKIIVGKKNKYENKYADVKLFGTKEIMEKMDEISEKEEEGVFLSFVFPKETKEKDNFLVAILVKGEDGDNNVRQQMGLVTIGKQEKEEKLKNASFQKLVIQEEQKFEAHQKVSSTTISTVISPAIPAFNQNQKEEIIAKESDSLPQQLEITQKNQLNESNNESIKIGSLSLYSGGIITLQTENKKYLRSILSSDESSSLFNRSEKSNIQVSNSNSLDVSNYFMVEVIENNKICLKSLNENLYFKVSSDKNKGIVNFTDDIDESTSFLINDKKNNKISLQLTNNKKSYLRLTGEDSKSIVAKEKEDKNSIFLINEIENYQEKINNYQEVIEDIQIHTEKKKVSSEKSSALQELNQKNLDSKSKEYTLAYNKTYTKSTTVNWGINLSANVQVKFKTGVPLIAEGGATFQLGVGVSAGGSHTYSESETITGTLKVDCPGNSMAVAKAILQEYELEVPITTTVSRYLTNELGQERKYVYKVNGTFKGKYAKVSAEYEKAVPLASLKSNIEQPTTK